MSHGYESFASGILPFGLHVGSNWNLSVGQKKSTFLIQCVCGRFLLSTSEAK